MEQTILRRAWRGLRGCRAEKTLRPWLYKIATNACLDAIALLPKCALPIDYGPPADPHDGPGPPRSGVGRGRGAV